MGKTICELKGYHIYVYMQKILSRVEFNAMLGKNFSKKHFVKFSNFPKKNKNKNSTEGYVAPRKFIKLVNHEI